MSPGTNGSPFADYTRHGFALCGIKPGTKAPTGRGWQLPRNVVRSPQGAAKLRGAGLVHEHSRTCAIDIDDLEGSRTYLAGRGLDIDALLNDPAAVRFESGKPNRGKLLYRLPEGVEPLPTHKAHGGGRLLFELRCKGAQDVLPPTVHPETNRPYTWRGDWRATPELPGELLALWHRMGVSPVGAPSAAPAGASLDKLRAVVSAIPAAKLDGHDDWLRAGMALHFETEGSDEGLALWDEASARADKYQGYDDLATRWASFRRTEGSSGPVARLSTLEGMADKESDAWAALTAMDFDVVTTAEAGAAIGKAAAKRFELVPFAEFIQRPAPQWLVDDLLPLGGLSMLYGAPVSGKSFIAVDIAVAIAAGTPWRGSQVRQQRVVYVAAEGAFGIAQRMRACAEHRGIDSTTLPLLTLPDSLNLFKGNDWRGLADSINAAEGAGLVIVDTLAQVTAGANENAGEDMQVVLSHCQRMRDATGAAVLLVHHSGKDAERGERGWSGIRAALDASLQVVRPTGCGTRELRVSKQKEGEEGACYPFRLRRVPMGVDDRGRELSTCIVSHEAAATASPQSREPRGKWQRIALAELHAMGGEAAFGDLLARAVDQVLIDPASGKPDRRREYAVRAVDVLRAQGLVTVEGGRVAVAGAADDFATADDDAEGLL